MGESKVGEVSHLVSGDLAVPTHQTFQPISVSPRERATVHHGSGQLHFTGADDHVTSRERTTTSFRGSGQLVGSGPLRVLGTLGTTHPSYLSCQRLT